MKTEEINCTIFIEREYNMEAWSPIHQHPKTKILTSVEYKIVLDDHSHNLHEMFDNDFKAKLVISTPEKKIEITESHLQEALKKADADYDAGIKSFNKNLTKILFGNK